MADYLPEFELPPENTNEESIEAEADPLVSTATDGEGSITAEINDVEDNDIDDELPLDIPEEVQEEPVEIKVKKKLERDDVFKTPTVLAVADEKPKKKKRVATQKQLDALSKARKEMAERRAIAKKLKEEGKTPPPSKRKQKVNKEVTEEIQKQGQIYNEEQIAKIVQKGISEYDEKRKIRKAEKAQTKEKQLQEAKVKDTLSRAMGMAAPRRDMWDDALGGMWT